MIDLDGAVVIVTGSARGVGAATARMLAARGARVVVNYSKSRDEAEAVADECRVASEALVCQADVSLDEDCRRMVAGAVETWGQIDGLVNNAGTTVVRAHRDLDGLDAADFQHVYGVNTIGPFQMIRAVAPHMRARGRGAVVNVSSVAGVYGIGTSLAYVGSKAALNMLTVALARALGPARYDRVKEHLETNTPLRAVDAPEDVARTIVWPLEAAPNMTGEILTMDARMGLIRGNAPPPR